MTKFDAAARTIVAALCTVVVSATLLTAAVGPAAVSQVAPITRTAA